MEFWTLIKDYPGYYISTRGRVLSIKSKKIILLKKRLSDGYDRAALYYKKKQKNKFVQELVLEAFFKKRPKNHQACHNNGIRDDNRLENLRWDTRKGNQADREKHGTKLIGENAARVKLKEWQIPEIRDLIKDGLTNKKISGMFGVSHMAISYIRNNKSWKHVK